MFNHAPSDYVCHICLGVQGVENEHTLLRRNDLIYQDDIASAFINSFWVGKNEGHVIIVPNQHFENIYDLPDEVGSRIFSIAKQVALALKQTYQCDGVTVRQNNEPASEQHAFHYHLHVFPRYESDEFNVRMTEKNRLSEPAERVKFGEKLRRWFEKYAKSVRV